MENGLITEEEIGRMSSIWCRATSSATRGTRTARGLKPYGVAQSRRPISTARYRVQKQKVDEKLDEREMLGVRVRKEVRRLQCQGQGPTGA